MPWAQILASGPVWGIMSAHFAFNWMFYNFLTCMPKYMQDILHFDTQASGPSPTLPHTLRLPDLGSRTGRPEGAAKGAHRTPCGSSLFG